MVTRTEGHGGAQGGPEEGRLRPRGEEGRQPREGGG